MKTLEQKLEQCYQVIEGCWVVVKYKGCWSGTQRQPDGIGYPRIPHNGKKVSAHVSAHEVWVGPVPVGYQVDHTCKNKTCINPAHLEAVTPYENLQRRWNKSQSTK